MIDAMKNIQNTNYELTVVVPVYNEQDSIQTVVEEWFEALNKLGIKHKFLILNDGSTDNTREVLDRITTKFGQVEVINKENAGHGRTCILGYNEAIQRGTQWVFQIDSDGQCNPLYFGSFWEKRHGCAAVFGKRVSRDDGFARRLISRFTRATVYITSRVNVKDPNVPYRLMRGDILRKAISNFPEDFGLSNILLAVILQKGCGKQMGYVKIGFRKRTGGEPGVKWAKFISEGWGLFKSLIKCRGYITERSSAISDMIATDKSGENRGR